MLEQKIRQFLVHSFLYYKLDESIISDTDYDSLCVELKGLIKDKSNFIYEELIQSSMGKGRLHGCAVYLRKQRKHSQLCW